MKCWQKMTKALRKNEKTKIPIKKQTGKAAPNIWNSQVGAKPRPNSKQIRNSKWQESPGLKRQYKMFIKCQSQKIKWITPDFPVYHGVFILYRTELNISTLWAPPLWTKKRSKTRIQEGNLIKRKHHWFLGRCWKSSGFIAEGGPHSIKWKPVSIHFGCVLAWRCLVYKMKTCHCWVGPGKKKKKTWKRTTTIDFLEDVGSLGISLQGGNPSHKVKPMEKIAKCKIRPHTASMFWILPVIHSYLVYPFLLGQPFLKFRFLLERFLAHKGAGNPTKWTKLRDSCRVLPLKPAPLTNDRFSFYRQGKARPQHNPKWMDTGCHFIEWGAPLQKSLDFHHFIRLTAYVTY